MEPHLILTPTPVDRGGAESAMTLAEMMTDSLEAVVTTAAIFAGLAQAAEQTCRCLRCRIKADLRADVVRTLAVAMQGLAGLDEDACGARIVAAGEQISAQFRNNDQATLGDAITANLPALITTAALLTTGVSIMAQDQDDDDADVLAGAVIAASQIAGACRDIGGLDLGDLKRRIRAETDRLGAPPPPTVA